jgi:serine/threonine protein kinase
VASGAGHLVARDWLSRPAEADPVAVRGGDRRDRRQSAAMISPLIESPLKPGSVVGQRYRLDHPIGAGSMGAVYAARDLVHDRPIALKIINRSHTADPTMVARFQREGRIVSELRHPNIVQVFAVERIGGDWIMAMELLEGTNLADAISAHTYEVDQAVPVLRAILDAVEIAHEHQIVHRDIKPQNVFLAHAGSDTIVKVLDFGVAKVVGLTAEEQLTRSGTILGTPEFMSPEQATSRGADHRSDLYAVACVAYAMLCGRPPFVDNWPMRILMKQAFEAPVPPSRLRPALAGASAVDVFIARALEKKPEDRYQTAREMRAALDALAAAQG